MTFHIGTPLIVRWRKIGEVGKVGKGQSRPLDTASVHSPQNWPVLMRRSTWAHCGAMNWLKRTEWFWKFQMYWSGGHRINVSLFDNCRIPGAPAPLSQVSVVFRGYCVPSHPAKKALIKHAVFSHKKISNFELRRCCAERFVLALHGPGHQTSIKCTSSSS